MTISVCIPNYNYEKYLGRTLASVLDQGVPLEVLISDNASTDRSVEIARGLNDARIKVHINQANVGFAGNLDRAASMATGETMLMLSSDDLVRPGALSAYQALFQAVGPKAVITSAADIIDPDDVITGRLGPDPELWRPEDRATNLLGPHHAPIYKVEAGELLKRCLLAQKNPFNFLATAYPRALYAQIEGYGGGRVINPDKWFHWRLLGAASHAYFVDTSLFAYRWHGQNQTAQQQASGALKYLVDEYVSTFELPKALLDRAGVGREEVERAFIERDIARHGLATLAGGSAEKARRILFFGASTYPKHAARNWKVWALGGMLAAGPVGRWAAKVAYQRRRGGS